MEFAHLQDVHLSFFYYLAENKPITVKTQNIFLLNSWSFWFHTRFLKEILWSFLDNLYNFFQIFAEENIIEYPNLKKKTDAKVLSY